LGTWTHTYTYTYIYIYVYIYTYILIYTSQSPGWSHIGWDFATKVRHFGTSKGVTVYLNASWQAKPCRLWPHKYFKLTSCWHIGIPWPYVCMHRNLCAYLYTYIHVYIYIFFCIHVHTFILMYIIFIYIRVNNIYRYIYMCIYIPPDRSKIYPHQRWSPLALFPSLTLMDNALYI
jgi:hypothetical protein